MEYHNFLHKLFCLTVLISFVERPDRVSLISGIENLYASQGYVTIFRRKFFVSQYRNISWRNPSVVCFGTFPVANKFMDERVGRVSKFSVEIFLSQGVENYRRGTL